MTDGERNRARLEFARSAYLFVRVRPDGFLVIDDIETELIGRIVKSHVVRKLFEDGVLVCQSKDGRRSTEGVVCRECGHRSCRPGLRIHLKATATVIYVIDLAVTAARECLDLLDDIEKEGRRPEDILLRLTVENRGRWGRVRLKAMESGTPQTRP